MEQARDPTTPGASVSEDAFLGGRLSLLQPWAHGRAGIDPVLLAAAVPARAGEHALELGSGTGIASLCLAWRVAGVQVQGVEIQAELVTLAALNAARNGLADRVRFEKGDLRIAPAAASLDHVLLNPPFHAAGTTRPSPVPSRALAHTEAVGDLAAWLRAALLALRPRGCLTLIHRTERLGDVLRLLEGQAGAIEIFPLWPYRGQPAKRVIVRARKGSAAPTTLLPGLVLHGKDGKFADATEAILRGGARLAF